jgi:hypothetical protein
MVHMKATHTALLALLPPTCLLLHQLSIKCVLHKHKNICNLSIIFLSLSKCTIHVNASLLTLPPNLTNRCDRLVTTEMQALLPLFPLNHLLLQHVSFTSFRAQRYQPIYQSSSPHCPCVGRLRCMAYLPNAPLSYSDILKARPSKQKFHHESTSPHTVWYRSVFYRRLLWVKLTG